MKHLQFRFALVTMLLSFALSTVSAYDFEVDGLRYSITSLTDLTCCLESVENSISGELVIPEKVKYLTKELTVTSFNLRGGANITSVVIPESITSIGNFAFENCTNLQSIVLHDGITRIGEYAFEGCKELSAISIPPSVTYIGKGAFDYCYELKKVILEDGAKEIRIRESSKVERVYDFGEYYYYYCGAFAYSTIDYLYVGRNCLKPDFDYGYSQTPESPFGSCTFKKVVIGDSCTSMPSFKEVHSKCETYVDTLIIVGRGITAIPASSFYKCKGLSLVDMTNSSITEIRDNAFSESMLKKIEFPNTVLAIGTETFFKCKQLEQINLGESVEQIGDGAFKDCDYLQAIELPQSLISIGGSCFQNCTSLKEIELPSKISSLNSYTFSGCSNLTTITIGESFISFGRDALSGCGNIERINCKCITPPSFVNQSFTIKQYTEAIVCVPKGTLESYQSADIWMNFWNLQEYDESTEINEVTAKKQNCNLLFDLQGRKLSAPQKGINIINGKKILVK